MLFSQVRALFGVSSNSGSCKTMQPAHFPLLVRVDLSFIIVCTTPKRRNGIIDNDKLFDQTLGWTCCSKLLEPWSLAVQHFQYWMSSSQLLPKWRCTHYSTTTGLLAEPVDRDIVRRHWSPGMQGFGDPSIG